MIDLFPEVHYAYSSWMMRFKFYQTLIRNKILRVNNKERIYCWSHDSNNCCYYQIYQQFMYNFLRFAKQLGIS